MQDMGNHKRSEGKQRPPGERQTMQTPFEGLRAKRGPDWHLIIPPEKQSAMSTSIHIQQPYILHARISTFQKKNVEAVRQSLAECHLASEISSKRFTYTAKDLSSVMK